MINNFTNEQFTLERITLHSEQVKQIYKARANYPLPYTPKVIISETQNDKRFMNILVQRGIPLLSQYLKQFSNNTLVCHIFKEMLSLLSVLTKRYGYFRITVNMIKVTNLGFFQIWINEFEESCHR